MLLDLVRGVFALSFFFRRVLILFVVNHVFLLRLSRSSPLQCYFMTSLALVESGKKYFRFREATDIKQLLFTIFFSKTVSWKYLHSVANTASSLQIVCKKVVQRISTPLLTFYFTSFLKYVFKRMLNLKMTSKLRKACPKISSVTNPNVSKFKTWKISCAWLYGVYMHFNFIDNCFFILSSWYALLFGTKWCKFLKVFRCF